MKPLNVTVYPACKVDDTLVSSPSRSLYRLLPPRRVVSITAWMQSRGQPSKCAHESLQEHFCPTMKRLVNSLS